MAASMCADAFGIVISGLPLDDIRIIDASRVLADLGADVIKVEPPDGDETRTWGATSINS